MKQYDFDSAKVIDMSTAAQRPQALTPETPVDVINRGHETLVRKFDGYDYALKPHTEGLLRMPFGAALHFQKHCTVPGTRDAGSGAEQSYIGIVRNATTGAAVDPSEFCAPFSREQCEAFGQKIEAIAREEGEEISVVPVSGMVASGRVPVGRQSSGGRRPLVRGGRDGKGGKTVAEAMAAPDGPNDAQQEIAEDVSESVEA